MTSIKELIESLNQFDLQTFVTKDKVNPGKYTNRTNSVITDPETGKKYFLNRVQDASKLNPDGTATFAWVRGPELQPQAGVAVSETVEQEA